MIRSLPRSLEAQSWDYGDPPVACVACGRTECACGDDRLFVCDGCGEMRPEDEVRRVRSSGGESYQCDRCTDSARDDALDPACAAGVKR